MFPGFLHIFARNRLGDYERAFVRHVAVKRRIGRNPLVERLILAGWLLIVLKCFAVIWIIDRWAVPFHPYWLIVPTILFAGLCTAVYYWRD